MGPKEKNLDAVLACKMEVNGKRIACYNCPHYVGQLEKNGRVIVLCNGPK